MEVEKRPKIMDGSKSRLRLARVLILILVGAMVLVGCAHIRVSVEVATPDVKLTETAIAHSVVATLTAQAPSPTATNVPTPAPSGPIYIPNVVKAGPLTPTPTPRPSPTRTRVPTKTPTPSLTRTRVPTKTQTPTLPLTPSQVSCQLSLVSPPDGASFGDETRVVTLQWQFDRALAVNEYFFVNVTYPHDGQTWYDGTWLDPARQIPSGTQDTSWELDDYLCAENLSDNGCFDWSVAIKRRKGGYPDLDDEVECLSPTWAFCWSGCERKPTSTPPEPTPVPPTATLPPTVYPPPPTETLPPYPAPPTATTIATWTPTSVATNTATAQP